MQMFPSKKIPFKFKIYAGDSCHPFLYLLSQRYFTIFIAACLQYSWNSGARAASMQDMILNALKNNTGKSRKMQWKITYDCERISKTRARNNNYKGGKSFKQIFLQREKNMAHLSRHLSGVKGDFAGEGFYRSMDSCNPYRNSKEFKSIKKLKASTVQ